MSLSQALQPTSALERARIIVFRRFGNRPVDAVDWQIKGPDQFFTFHLGGSEPLRVQVNAAHGLIINVESDEEDFFVRLHSGEIVGDGGKVLGLGWGLGLTRATSATDERGVSRLFDVIIGDRTVQWRRDDQKILSIEHLNR